MIIKNVHRDPVKDQLYPTLILIICSMYSMLYVLYNLITHGTWQEK